MCLGHKCSNYFSNTGINARFFLLKRYGTSWHTPAIGMEKVPMQMSF